MVLNHVQASKTSKPTEKKNSEPAFRVRRATWSVFHYYKNYGRPSTSVRKWGSFPPPSFPSLSFLRFLSSTRGVSPFQSKKRVFVRISAFMLLLYLLSSHQAPLQHMLEILQPPPSSIHGAMEHCLELLGPFTMSSLSLLGFLGLLPSDPSKSTSPFEIGTVSTSTCVSANRSFFLLFPLLFFPLHSVSQ